MPDQITVIGVTGTVGSRVASKLAAKGVAVRGIARDPSQFSGNQNVDLVAADFTNRQEAEKALAGSQVVYLTLPEEGEDPLALESAVGLNAIEAARKAGIDHMLLHTALQSDRGDTGVAIIDNKRPIEEAVMASEFGYTILRPAWFLQNLFGAKEYLEQGMVSMPIPPEQRIGGISVEDIANAAVAFFEKGPQNRGFDLYLPGGVSGPMIAEAAGQVLERPVQFYEFTDPIAEYVAGFPISERHKELYVELFAYFRLQDYLGEAEEITSVLPDFQYTSVAQFMRSELFAG